MPVKRNPLHKSLVEEGAKSQLQFLQLIPLHKSLVRGGCQVPIAVPVETLLCCQKRISASQKGNPLHKSLGGCQVPRIQLQFQCRSSNSCDPMKWTSVQFKKEKPLHMSLGQGLVKVHRSLFHISIVGWTAGSLTLIN